jgi:hypothetical protein
MPLRRYHTPSFVRQAASASILPPVVRIITDLEEDADSVRGGPVETGPSRPAGCAVVTFDVVVAGCSSAATNSGDAEFWIVGEDEDDGVGTARGFATCDVTSDLREAMRR